MYTNQKNKESKLQKSTSNVCKPRNGEFGQDKWVKEVLYPDFSDPMITFPCQREIARFVQETTYSSKIPSTSVIVLKKIVPAVPEKVKDTHRINCVTQKVKNKESKVQKSQSNDWNSCINHIMCGSIVCLPTQRFAIKTETTSHNQLSPEAGLRILPDLTESPVKCRGSFSGEFEQDKWIKEVPYPNLLLQSNSDLHDELTVTFFDQNKITWFVQDMPNSSKICSISKSVPVVSERVSDKHHINCITLEAKEKQSMLQKSQSFSGEFQQVKWIEEVPYPILQLQSVSDLHNESTITFLS